MNKKDLTPEISTLVELTFSPPDSLEPTVSTVDTDPIGSDTNSPESRLMALEQALKLREQDIEIKSASLINREETLKAEANRMLQMEIKLYAMEMDARNGFTTLLDEKFRDVKKALDEKELLYSRRLDKLDKKAQALLEKEVELKEAEVSRDSGYHEQRQALNRDLQEKRRAAEKELSDLRQKRFSELEKDLEKERSQRLDALAKELADTRGRLSKELDGARAEYDRTQLAEVTKIQKEAKELARLKAELASGFEEIEYEKMRLASRQERLGERESNIDIEVARRTQERLKSCDALEARHLDECQRLRDSLLRSTESLDLYEELKRRLGNEEPEQILLKLSTKEEELKKLRTDLLNRPTQEMQAHLDRTNTDKMRVENACQRLSEENKELRDKSRAQSVLDAQILDLTGQNKSLTRQMDSIEADNSRLSADLKRLQACYQREGERDERIGDIETPYFPIDHVRGSIKPGVAAEIEWLESINAGCLDHGLRFPKRILWAYHTALKTAEWSPLTVLAGVSGTGKSELPKLYSHFGGIKFLNLAVQPNWDSQESMLGFFNSIDNKFDAQQVLRFLAQSQLGKTADYPAGLQDAMCLVLLDEMNLAHVELYFAEFLSKLELRRSMKGQNVPTIEVKLGAGIKPYDLPLGRNVLWAGTMNQDETTKTLSDKVLDRGIVIHFPRPSIMERRSRLKSLGTPAPLLSRKTWESWWCRESTFTDEQIMPYKCFIEETNKSLAKVGRALGHRVWQSIEYYMNNYPSVRLDQELGKDPERSMKIAFEDQLVQKVMPKLRGIETRGKGKSDCLDRIREQLINDGYDTLLEDFDSACEFGYGQFMWNSANYLKDLETGTAEQGEENVVQGSGTIAPAVESTFKGEQPIIVTASELKDPVDDVDYDLAYPNATPRQRQMFKDHARKKAQLQ
jgi:hypothetical protein